MLRIFIDSKRCIQYFLIFTLILNRMLNIFRILNRQMLSIDKLLKIVAKERKIIYKKVVAYYIFILNCMRF